MAKGWGPTPSTCQSSGPTENRFMRSSQISSHSGGLARHHIIPHPHVLRFMGTQCPEDHQVLPGALPGTGWYNAGWVLVGVR